MNILLKLVLACSLILSSAAYAELVVVVNKANTDDLNPELIKRIFLGKVKGFPTAGQALPVDLPENNPTRVEYLSKVVKKSQTQYASYWAKVIFTGKAVPPKVVPADSEVIKLVSRNPNLIGYVNASSVTDAVRVVGKY
jgi:ABC-type phosphate transport system substrate-binding protein